MVSRASAAHAEALHRALTEVHGVRTEGLASVVSPAGRTDGEIARLLLLQAQIGAERIDHGASAVRNACTRLYIELCPPSLADRVVPGIPALLKWLAGRDDVRLSLVTGNFEPVARLKLARAGIGGYFPVGQGGFGSDSEDRAVLPAIARRRAGADGVPHPRETTVVIGDTPRDIACARADGVRCLAVTTGPFAAAQLHDADGVADHPEALRDLLTAALDD
ncbi:MAG: haloacid dehalogenase-like hydrolase [Actinomycetota bacterium]|nr:haloacid dehalogenase-like hydrolase [Actinomycetota bacterium]